jgi:3'(2'),5'-bisphosphate nucleotidase
MPDPLAICEAAARAGGSVLQEWVGRFAVSSKGPRDFVTEADVAAQAEVQRIVLGAFPDHGFVGEESAPGGAAGGAGEYRWIVDPLDGTREFLAGNGEFTINLGLVRDGAPVAGAVYAPAFGRLWWGAARAYGAHVAQGQPMPAPAQATVLRTRAAASPLAALESRSHMTPQTAGAMARLAPVLGRPVGSSMKFCLIASGEADLCLRLGPTMEWDTAAGDAVLRAAGGNILFLLLHARLFTPLLSLSLSRGDHTGPVLQQAI